MSQLLDDPENFPETIRKMLGSLLERNLPDGVVPQPLLEMVIAQSWQGKGATLGTSQKWTDAAGNTILQLVTIRSAGAGPNNWVKYRSLEMDGLVRGADRKYRWPMACAVSIMSDVEVAMYSTADKRQWWLWQSNGGNSLLVTHDYEGDGQFRYWLNPDD